MFVLLLGGRIVNAWRLHDLSNQGRRRSRIWLQRLRNFVLWAHVSSLPLVWKGTMFLLLRFKWPAVCCRWHWAASAERHYTRWETEQFARGDQSRHLGVPIPCSSSGLRRFDAETCRDILRQKLLLPGSEDVPEDSEELLKLKGALRPDAYILEKINTHTHTLLKSCWVLPGFVYERGYRTWNFNFRWCLPPCTLCTPIVFITKEMQLHYVNRATIMPFDRSYTPLSTSHRKWQFEFLNRKNYVAIRSHFTFRLCFNTLHTTCFTSPGRLAIFGPEVILKFWICYWCVSVLTMPPAPSCCFMSGATHREESLVVVIACERFFFQWDRCLRLMSKWNMILLVYFSTYNSEAFNAFHIICCCIFVAQASQVVGWISLCLSWLWSQGVARRGARCGVPWLQLGLAGVTGQHRVGVSCM